MERVYTVEIRQSDIWTGVVDVLAEEEGAAIAKALDEVELAITRQMQTVQVLGVKDGDGRR